MLVLGLGYDHWGKQKLLVVLEFDLRVNLSLDKWRGEVSQVEHGVKDIANRLQVVLGG